MYARLMATCGKGWSKRRTVCMDVFCHRLTFGLSLFSPALILYMIQIMVFVFDHRVGILLLATPSFISLHNSSHCHYDTIIFIKTKLRFWESPFHDAFVRLTSLESTLKLHHKILNYYYYILNLASFQLDSFFVFHNIFIHHSKTCKTKLVKTLTCTFHANVRGPIVWYEPRIIPRYKSMWLKSIP